MKTVDLRSDTLTRPTEKMRAAMSRAEVGDDVFNEDPTLNRLQDYIAELTGMEKALFVTSGTQGNQICINAHTQPGQEVIVDKNSHIFNYESGSPAMLAGVQLHCLDGTNGIVSKDEVAAAVRPADDHYPQTGLVCLENTHNRGGGFIYPLEEIEQIAEFCRTAGLPLHLDGARLWNASVATGISIKTYCELFDSVSLCFSKGLGAPVGSVVAGKADFIQRTHFYRKAYGGGVRQGGILAAAALHAIEHHLPLLSEDHRRAKSLAAGINEIPGLSVDLPAVHTNIVLFDIDDALMTAASLSGKLAEEGILQFPFGPQRIRLVTHLEIADDAVDHAINVIKKVVLS